VVSATTNWSFFRTKGFDSRRTEALQAPVAEFRYDQFCPLTRAVEILGERWTVLILRELFLGPKRFSELKSALNGVSPSVLADRLAKLEERRIVARRELLPPALSAVYELDEAGLAMKPLLAEMTRWGLRFLGSPGPADRIRPEWLLLGLQVFARTDAAEDIGALLHVEAGDESVDIYVRGGNAGTVVSNTPLASDVRISAAPMEMLMFTSGVLDPEAAASALTFDGDTDIAQRIPALFDFRPTPAAPRIEQAGQVRQVRPDHARRSSHDQPPASARPRRKLKPAADRGHAAAATTTR